MIVNLVTNVSCPAPGCGHKIRYTSVATIRVNKRSLRTTDTGGRIGWLEHWRCPGCGEVLPRDPPLDREPYRLAERTRRRSPSTGGRSGASRTTGRTWSE